MNRDLPKCAPPVLFFPAFVSSTLWQANFLFHWVLKDCVLWLGEHFPQHRWCGSGRLCCGWSSSCWWDAWWDAEIYLWLGGSSFLVVSLESLSSCCILWSKRVVGWSCVLMVFQWIVPQSCLALDSQWQQLIRIPVGLQLNFWHLSWFWRERFLLHVFCVMYLCCRPIVKILVKSLAIDTIRWLWHIWIFYTPNTIVHLLHRIWYKFYKNPPIVSSQLDCAKICKIP